MNLIPNINAPSFTLSAIAIGYILLDGSTPAEQNSLGNWFMLIGQVLCTNSAQQQVLNNRTGQSNSTNRHVINDDNLKDDNKTVNSKNNVQEQIDMMNKVIKALQQQINDLQK